MSKLENRPLLVLDLDETLFHSRSAPDAALGKPSFRLCDGLFHSYRRPHLDHFLDSVADDWTLGVWTSASSDYAAEACSHLFKGLELAFLWSRDRCTPYRPMATDMYSYGGDTFWIKNLAKVKKLGFQLERTLIVDDLPVTAMRNYGNYVRVDPFKGDPEDFILDSLAKYLPRLLSEDNFRTIEKRGWLATVLEEEFTPSLRRR